MDIIYYIFIFIFGAIIGSFLNVVILRYDSGKSIFYGRSMCFSCNKKLSWYELIPIVSFLFQRGKCTNCCAGVSLQYIIVEAITGVLFLGVFMKGYEAIETILLLAIMSLLVVIAVYDFRHKIIPDFFVFSFIILSAFLLLLNSGFQIPSTSDLLAGPILFLPFAALWYFSHGTWMGFGDAKLAWGIGWFLGFSSGVSAIIISFWIGAVGGISLIGLGKISRNKFITLPNSLKMFTIKSEIPFGPFMVLATLFVFFLDINTLSLVY